MQMLLLLLWRGEERYKQTGDHRLDRHRQMRSPNQTHTQKKIYIYIYKKKIYEIQRHNTEEVTRPFRGDSLKKAFRFVIFFFVFVFVSKNKIKRGKYEMTW